MQLVDADAHVNPIPTFWDEYLPKKFIGRGPKFVAGGPDDKNDWMEFEGTRKAINLQSSTSGQGKKFKIEGKMDLVLPGNWEPEARLKDMDKDGVQTAVMYGGGPLGTADNELYLASFEAYNHWLADFCSYAPKRLVGAAYLPMQDVIRSAWPRMRRRAVCGPSTFPLGRSPARSSVAVSARRCWRLRAIPKASCNTTIRILIRSGRPASISTSLSQYTWVPVSPGPE